MRAALVSLVAPPSRPPGFAALDGYRALLTLWMVIYHAFAYVCTYYKYNDVLQVSDHVILTPMLLGPYAVDGFFALTGFLLAYPLLSKSSGGHKKSDDSSTNGHSNGNEVHPGQVKVTNVAPASSSFDIWHWYYRRVTRMVPFYAIILLFYCQIAATKGRYRYDESQSEFDALMRNTFNHTGEYSHTQCHTSWLSLLFVNNIIPGAGCLVHSWSMCVQFQFYLWLPVIYYRYGHTRSFAYVCSAGIIISTCMRYIGFWHMATMNNPVDGMIIGFLHYASTANRMNIILMGSLAAWLVTQTTFVQWLHTHSIARKIPLILGALVFIGASYWSTWFSDGRLLTAPGAVAGQYAYHGWWHSVYWILFCVGSPASGIAYTYILLAAVYRIGSFGRTISHLLSFKGWYGISQLGFAAYLIHPVIYEQYIRLIWIMPTPLTLRGVIAYSGVSLIVVILVSCVLYIVIEQPLESWLRNVGDHWLWLKRFVRAYVIVLFVCSVLSICCGVVWLWYTPKDAHVASSQSFMTQFPALASLPIPAAYTAR